MTDSQPSASTSAQPSPQTQAGFSQDSTLAALSLKARIQAGENIPRDELIAFIRLAETDLAAQRKAVNKAEKPKDVDFF